MSHATDNVRYFDSARQMLADLAADSELDGCYMAVTIVVAKDESLISGIAYKDETRPFVLVGGLELMKRRVMSTFLDNADEL